ncbi:phosphoadenosine phosphosulfate reductase family protein [bacterium]|nr:phosphoadenosine phosphosulfate reductase family protein [bacterium]|tara:strand:+ start:101 stop:790 length:690 start_codon:yes stop_codon:yes gene_type:complete
MSLIPKGTLAVTRTEKNFGNLMPQVDIAAVNRQLRQASPDEIIRWALGLNLSAMVTTSMGINAAATLHAVVTQAPNTPVVWIDSGFNLKDTYVNADLIEARLGLNLHTYSPSITAERLIARLGGIPQLTDTQHQWFTEQVKLAPFRRALTELQPALWFTGIRQGETAHRRQLDIVSEDARGLLKIAPFFYATVEDVDAYMREHNLPSCRRYFDPTKGETGRECGLHTAA